MSVLISVQMRSVRQQIFGLLEIARVEAFAEPAVGRSEKLAGLIPLALIAPQPRHAHRGSEFPGLCLLLPRDRKRTREISFCFCRIRFRRQQCDLPANAIDLSLAPSLLGSFDCVHSFTNAASGVIDLTDF